MATWRESVARWFEALGRWVYHNRMKTLVAVMLVVVGLASNLRNMTIDTSSDSFFHEDDPALLDYNAYRDQFGLDERIVVAVRASQVFDEQVLEKLRALHEDLENDVPHIDDITSLINARNTRGEADQLVVEDLLEHWPRNAAELAAVRDRARQNPLYRNMLLSEDGTFTTIIIQTNTYSVSGAEEDVLAGFDDDQAAVADTVPKRKYLSNKENSQAVAAVKRVIQRHRAPGFAIYLAGSPVVSDTLKRMMKRDIRGFIKKVVAAVALFLALIFRRVSGVVLPLVTVVFAALCTIGLMALTGTSITMPTQILPSFLLAVGVGASVHLLAIFYKRFDATGDKEGALVHALGHSGLPIVMTSLTTAVALGSFSMAEIAPIADLGKFAAAGVLISLLFTVVLLPALLALSPLRPKKIKPDAGEPLMDRLLTGVADFSVRHARKIVFLSLVLIGIALILACQLRFSHNQLTWFPESSGVRKSTETIDRAMNGSITMELVVDTGRENGLHDPRVLNALDELCTSLEEMKGDGYFVGKAWSLTTILKEINKALHENRSEFYSIPQDRDLISQELLLFENSGSDDLEDVVDSRFSKARVAIKLPWVDAVKYEEIVQRVERLCEEKLGDSVRVTVTGLCPLMGNTFTAAIRSSAQSYLIAFGSITVMMILLIGSVRIGLLSMIPNILPILVAMAVMKLANMPLDMFTMLVGSIAIGLAVDDTVHFMHNFRRYYRASGDVHEAVRLTLTSTGRAMLVTTIVLSLGFFVYMFAQMSNVFNFGLLTGLAIIVALLADFFLGPALMVLVTRQSGQKKRPIRHENGMTNGYS